jgi:hypothetical protein
MAVTDPFTRADGDPGANWQTVLGSPWAIVSNALKPTSQYTATAIRRVGTFPNAQYAEWKTEVKDPSGGDVTQSGPAVRMDANGNCYFLYIFQTFAELWRRVGGSNSFVDSGVYAALTYATYYTFRVTFDAGFGYTVALGGVTIFTGTDALGSIASGNPSAYALTGQTSMFHRFDDFECTDALVGGTPTRRSLMLLGVS